MGNLSDYLGEAGVFAGKGLINYGLNYLAWKRQNEYNLPINQKARLEAAGLTPAAAAEALSGQNGQGAAFGAVSGENPSVSPMQKRFMDAELQMKQEYNDAAIDELNSRAEKNRAEANRTNVLTPVEKEQILQSIKESISKSKLNDTQAANVQAVTNKLIAMYPIERQTALAALQGLRYENDVKMVKSELAKTYHINPDSEFGAQIVQLLLSGDSSVLNTIIESFESVVSGPFQVGGALNNTYQKGHETLEGYLGKTGHKVFRHVVNSAERALFPWKLNLGRYRYE